MDNQNPADSQLWLLGCSLDRRDSRSWENLKTETDYLFTRHLTSNFGLWDFFSLVQSWKANSCMVLFVEFLANDSRYFQALVVLACHCVAWSGWRTSDCSGSNYLWDSCQATVSKVTILGPFDAIWNVDKFLWIAFEETILVPRTVDSY